MESSLQSLVISFLLPSLEDPLAMGMVYQYYQLQHNSPGFSHSLVSSFVDSHIAHVHALLPMHSSMPEELA